MFLDIVSCFLLEVIILFVTRWDTMDESEQRRWKVTPLRNASNPNFNFLGNNLDSFTTCGFCYETHWNRRQQRLELPYN